MSLRAAVLFAVLAAALPATGDIVAEWHSKIARSTTALESGDYERSLTLSEGMVRQMIERLGPGNASTQAFGIVVMHKALALAGLGRRDDALWYWHIALGLYPDFAKYDLSAFGEAGKFLSENAEPRKPTEYNRADAKPLTPEMTPPKLVKRVMPDFPRGAKAFAVEGRLVVEVEITTAGTITSPVIKNPLPAPTLSYVALEAVRRWRFEPATNRGQPIKVCFELAVNFNL
jgi:TonB family protein